MRVYRNYGSVTRLECIFFNKYLHGGYIHTCELPAAGVKGEFKTHLRLKFVGSRTGEPFVVFKLQTDQILHSHETCNAVCINTAAKPTHEGRADTINGSSFVF